MPPLRLAVVNDIAEHPGSTTADVRKRLSKPRATVDRQLQALHMIGVFDVLEEEAQWAGKPTTRWYYTVAAGLDPNVLNPTTVPEMSAPTSNPLKETNGNLGLSGLPPDISGSDPRCKREGWADEDAFTVPTVGVVLAQAEARGGREAEKLTGE